MTNSISMMEEEEDDEALDNRGRKDRCINHKIQKDKGAGRRQRPECILVD